MHVDRDSSLGGRAPKSGCREESYTSEYFSANVALSEHDIHSVPVYMPPLFMPDDRLLSFSCFRNFLAIEGNSDPEKKKMEKKMEFDIRVFQRIGNDVP